MSMLVREEQYEKALSLIDLTDDGMIMLLSLLHSLNAFSKIDVTFLPLYSFGISILLRFFTSPASTPYVPSGNRRYFNTSVSLRFEALSFFVSSDDVVPLLPPHEQRAHKKSTDIIKFLFFIDIPFCNVVACLTLLI